MALTVRCPSAACGRESSVPEEHAGRALRCPHCGQRFTVGSSDATTPHPAPAVDGVPAQVGRFRILSCLGAGAFGTVYRAHDPQLDREVALKVPLPGTLDAPGRLERFLREARAAARLHHPNIVPVLEAGGRPPACYIASAYVGGRTLARALADGPFEAARAARAARQLAGALGYAHSQGVVHRDVKPANVLLDERDDAHLTDFGLAQLRDAAEKLTQDGALLGTPAYMAPELVQGGGASPASDQYGLGVLLYELLCGRPPFEGPPEAVLYQIVHAAPPPPRRLRPGLPRDLETICLKTLAKPLADRYPDCRDLADDLRRFLEGEPVRARRLNPAERLARWCVRQPVLAGLLALVVGVTALFVGSLAVSNRRIAEQKQRAEDALAEVESQQRTTREALEGRTRAMELEWRGAYFRRIALAHREWYASNVPGVERYLAECLPDPGRPDPARPDVRGWEWHYLDRLCHAELMTLHPGGGPRAVAFSPDGNHLAVGCEDRSVRLWNLATRQEVRVLRGHETAVRGVAFRPDGERLASAGEGAGPAPPSPGELKVWDLRSGRAVLSLPGRTCVAFSPDGKRLASDGAGEEVHVWDEATGAEVASLRRVPDVAPHTGPVNSVAFSPDGKRVAAGTASSDQRVRAWEVESGREVFSPRDHDSIRAVAYSPDGRWLISALWRDVRVRDAATGELHGTLRGHGAYLSGLALSGRGPRLASAGGADRTVRVWDIETGEELLNLRGHTAAVRAVAFSRDGRRIASADAQEIKVWDAAASLESRTLTGATTWRSDTAVAFSPDGRLLAVGCRDNLLRLWDLDTTAGPRTFRGSPRGASSVAFSPDGGRLAALGPDGVVQLLDVGSGKEDLAFKVPISGWNDRIRFSPDGRQIILTGRGHDLIPDTRAWDAADGRELYAAEGAVLASGRDGRFILRAGRHTFEVADTEARRDPIPLPGKARLVTLSSDGRFAATAEGREARVWDVQAGRPTWTLSGHTDEVTGLAFTPDGSRLATCSNDMTVKLWDTATGQDILTFREHTGWLHGVIFSPDGHRLASWGNDESVRVWDGTPRQELRRPNP